MTVPATTRPRVTGWAAHQFAKVVPVRGLGRRARAVAIAVTARVVVANAVAALFAGTYLTVTEDLQADDSWPEIIIGNAAFYAAALLVFSVAALVRGKKVLAPAWSWLDGDEPPTDEERRALLAAPVRVGLFPLRYWTVAAAGIAITRPVMGADAGQTILGVVVILVGGLVAALLGFLLGERALRPTFALALAGRPPETPAALGLRGRLVLAWALGTGVPLLGVVLTPLVVPDSTLGVTWAMGALAVVGLVGGFATMAITARSIVAPVRAVRASLARIGAGDLGVTVAVDDGGELGQLQGGVNEMVAGLRERAELEDLFGRHVGPAVARQALERGVELGGEVRSVTALFVDLRGSTELVRRLPPVEVVELLNRFFDAVVRCSDAEGGWLDKFAGDAALCVFGAPGEQPDHATRALRTGRALVAELARLRSTLPALDAGIGIASGEAVAGHVGTETRLEYTVIGPPVNVAARLTIAAKARPSRLLADAAAVGCADADEAARWVESGAVDLKGLPPGLPVWQPADVPSR